MAEAINVEKREAFGKHNAKRLRNSGKLPAVLYGHGRGTERLSLDADDLAAAIRHGSKLVDLKGGLNESALIRELQWDTFGMDVLHVDLIRVDADERLEVEVAVELRGIAPGANEGGVVQQLVHEVEIEVLATSIPEKLHLNVNELELEQTLLAKDIEDMPQGAKLITDPETVMVTCEVPQEEEDEEGDEASAEPEVIGRKPEDEEGEEENA